jgi:hypothetical protein
MEKIAPRKHGPYEIRLWRSGDRFGGRAFLRDKAVLPQREGATMDGLVRLIGEELDERAKTMRRARTRGQIATAKEFEEALLSVRINEGQSRMLGALLAAPDHSLTATQLAAAAGYAAFGGANLWLGRLGAEVASIVGYLPGQQSKEIAMTRTLATPAKASARQGDGDFRWTLRPEVVLALRGDAGVVVLPPLKMPAD